jgi:pyruvate dehydrogenase E2 component (dihydrolipoamide acetyltransferase)
LVVALTAVEAAPAVQETVALLLFCRNSCRVEVITMPRLSDTMTEGKVAKWHKNVGDTV